MNSLDIIISILVLIPALLGLKNGLLKSIFSLIGIIAGLFFATRYNDRITASLNFLKWDEKLISLMSFIIIIILAYLISIYIANKISRINFITKFIDKIFGTAFGVFKGLIIASLLLLLTTNTFNLFGKKTTDESKFYSAVINIAPEVYDYIKKFTPGAKDFYEEFNHLLFTNVKP